PVVERKSQIVVDLAGMVPVGGKFPDFLDAQTVFLRFAAKPEIRDQSLGQRAPRPLGDQRIAGLERDALGKARLGPALAVPPQIPRAHPAHPPAAWAPPIDRI